MARVTLRPAAAEDEAFLRVLYADIRADEMTLTGWPPEQCDRFLDSQFELQTRHYSLHFGLAGHNIIVRGRDPVGRLWLHDNEERRLIVDIALFGTARGQGLGSSLIRQSLAQARRKGCPCVRLHALGSNSRAIRLYQRLGFTPAGFEGTHLRMEWRPS